MPEYYLDDKDVSSRWSRLFYALNTGPLAVAAKQITEQLEEEDHGLPFASIVASNLGNPHKFSKPNSYIRDVLSLVMSPELLEDEDIAAAYPADIVARAATIASWLPADLSGDLHPEGVPQIREAIAAFINERDGPAAAAKSPAQASNILLSNGATLHINTCIRSLCTSPTDGCIIPVPEYPAYGSAAGIAGAAVVPYHLNEDKGWAIEFEELERAYNQAISKGITPRVLVLVNPGNPTGTLFSREDIERACEFAVERGVTVIADEVYQKNLWTNPQDWVSFRRVAIEGGYEARGLRLASFHSISKGFIGECGLRGGYVECAGPWDPEVLASMRFQAGLSSINAVGQVVTYLMVCEPDASDESFEQYNGEVEAARASMKERAERFIEFLRTLEGVEVSPPGGAMYVFPRMHLPEKFIAKARAEGASADEVYCAMLLEHSGMRVVPGSAFGQKEGEFHLRSTVLASLDNLEAVFPLWRAMHEKIMAEYA